MASRTPRTYRIEMGGRTVLVSLGLAVLTGLVVFYMGVLAGKGSRTAEAPAPESATPVAQIPGQAQAPQGTEPGQLAFSEALLKDKPVVEDLLQSQKQTAQQTDQLIARAERELTVEEVPAQGLAATRREVAPAAAPTQPAPAGTAPATAESKSPPRREAPAKAAALRQAPAKSPAAGAKDAGLYTVQVFSSQSRESATQLVNRLKGLGFSAYLNQFQDASRVNWYRVRVGKTNRAEAERLKANLEAKANLKSTQVLEL
jgi:cell division protein FtsN